MYGLRGGAPGALPDAPAPINVDPFDGQQDMRLFVRLRPHSDPHEVSALPDIPDVCDLTTSAPAVVRAVSETVSAESAVATTTHVTGSSQTGNAEYVAHIDIPDGAPDNVAAVAPSPPAATKEGTLTTASARADGPPDKVTTVALPTPAATQRGSLTIGSARTNGAPDNDAAELVARGAFLPGSTRQGFTNTRNTCHLAATLQGLFSCADVLRDFPHRCTPACDAPCVVRMLSVSEYVSRTAAFPPHLNAWESLFQGWEMDLHVMQDVHEDLMHIIAGLPATTRARATTQCLQYNRRTFTCACVNDTVTTCQEPSCHVELDVVGLSSEGSSIQAIVEQRATWTSPSDSHCEQCQAAATQEQRWEYISTGSLLIFTLKRYKQESTSRNLKRYKRDATSSIRSCEAMQNIPKIRTVVEPSEVLDLLDTTWTLHAVIVHRGPSCDDGHYVCYVRRETLWKLFDDDKTHLSDSLPPETHTDGVVFFYQSVRDITAQQSGGVTAQHNTPPEATAGSASQMPPLPPPAVPPTDSPTRKLSAAALKNMQRQAWQEKQEAATANVEVQAEAQNNLSADA